MCVWDAGIEDLEMLRWQCRDLLPKAESKTGLKGPNVVIGAQEIVGRGVGCNTCRGRGLSLHLLGMGV